MVMERILVLNKNLQTAKVYVNRRMSYCIGNEIFHENLLVLVCVFKFYTGGSSFKKKNNVCTLWSLFERKYYSLLENHQLNLLNKNKYSMNFKLNDPCTITNEVK